MAGFAGITIGHARRCLGWGLVAIAALAFALPAEAQRRRTEAPPRIDLATPEGALAAQRRLWCSATDGAVVTWYWSGSVWSRRAGEPDRRLFDVEGMNIRTCGPVADDAQRGRGFRTVSREILLYRDPATGALLDHWQNPWTNERVRVLHVANDPVNASIFERNRDGSPLRFTGELNAGQWWTTTTVPLFYANPLAGEFQAEVGGGYHATEMFNFFGDVADLTDPARPSANVRVSWVRISDWLPWMRMGDREGMLYFNTSGRKLVEWRDMPARLRMEIERHWPAYTAPPPLNDARPNETSWTYFQRVRRGEIVPPDLSAPAAAPAP